MKTYKGNIKFNLPLLIAPLLLLIPLLESDTPSAAKIIGFTLLSLIAIILVILPLASKLEIGSNYIKSYFLGVLKMEVHPSDVQNIEYRNILYGGLGVGKGLVIKAKIKDKNKTLTISEKFYGRDAVENAKRTLENK